MTIGAYLGFVGLAAVLAVTPGPDTFLSLRFALAGRRPGLLAASGTSLAVFGWAALAAVGVAAVLRASPVAYASLTVVGGLYLLFLGVRALQALRAPVEPASPVADVGATPQQPARKGTGAPFLAGIGTCLTNPKTGLFFVALFPQFVSPGDGALYVTLVLGGTVALVMYAYLVGVVVIADAARRWLARPRVTRAIEASSGAILAGLGLYLLVDAAFGFLV